MKKELRFILASTALMLAGCPADDTDAASDTDAGSTTDDATTGTPTTGTPTGDPTTGDDGSSDDGGSTGDTTGGVVPTTFDVVIENISEPSAVFGAGAFDTPEGADEPGPAFPGDRYVVEFGAAPGHYLSFGTMFVQSNDFFIAPAPEGIPLFDDQGVPLTGDITDLLELWDAGTEEDEEPGTGDYQAPRQDGDDMGPDDDNTAIRLASEENDSLPAMSALVDASLSYDGEGVFTLTIENVSTMDTLMHSQGSSPVPLSPGAYVIHSSEATFFEEGAAATPGMEAMAEDGHGGVLSAEFEPLVGLAVPLAPGVFAAHFEDAPLFAEGEPDFGAGLEALAEDGDASALGAALAKSFASSGVFNTPDGADEPGPAFPGGSYSFQVTGSVGDNLSFATMFVQSNDLFYAPGEAGIPLFDGDGNPVSGDITDQVSLWDAGTEDNQWPGAGPDQAPRQSGPDTGGSRSGPVEIVADDFTYAPTDSVIRVTITPVE